MRSILLSGTFAALVLALPASAQTLDGRSLKPNLVKPATPPGGAGPRAIPPPAVPGARARADSIAPSTRGTNDLPPTEALFDAINRGDILAARDSLSRGADLDGTNLLGLTPLELSVDLARNDISFLLLSMRGARSGGGPQQASAEPGTPTPAQRRIAERQAAAQARAEAAAERRTAVAATRATPAAARQSPALFAGDGGSPVPAQGFLGFDSRRSATP